MSEPGKKIAESIANHNAAMDASLAVAHEIEQEREARIIAAAKAYGDSATEAANTKEIGG